MGGEGGPIGGALSGPSSLTHPAPVGPSVDPGAAVRFQLDDGDILVFEVEDERAGRAQVEALSAKRPNVDFVWVLKGIHVTQLKGTHATMVNLARIRMFFAAFSVWMRAVENKDPEVGALWDIVMERYGEVR